MNLDLSCLDLGKVEKVVDQIQEVQPARVHVGHVPALFLVQGAEPFVRQELREAEDGVQWCPQLVRHVRQELRLVAGGFLGLKPGFVELEVGRVQRLRPLFHPGLQLPGCMPQFLIQPRILGGNHRLARHGGEELDFPFIGGPRNIREYHEKAANLLPIQQRHNHH